MKINEKMATISSEYVNRIRTRFALREVGGAAIGPPLLSEQSLHAGADHAPGSAVTDDSVALTEDRKA